VQGAVGAYGYNKAETEVSARKTALAEAMAAAPDQAAQLAILQQAYPDESAAAQFAQINRGSAKKRDWEWYDSLPPEEQARVDVHEGSKLPNERQNWENYNSLSGDEQEDYLIWKRAGKYIDTGSKIQAVNPVTNETTVIAEKDLAPKDTLEHIENVTRTKAETAFTVASKQALPKLRQNADLMLTTIRKLKNHPGLESITGKSSITNVVAIPGSDRANALAVRDQLKGQVFLKAFNDLKGGGHITEIEGLKAENSLARLHTAQSLAEFNIALNELEIMVLTGLERAQAAAGMTGTAGTTGSVPTIDELLEQYPAHGN